MNAGKPDSSRTASAQGENRNSTAPEVTRKMPFCTKPKVRITRLSGRLEASRRARVSLS